MQADSESLIVTYEPASPPDADGDVQGFYKRTWRDGKCIETVYEYSHMLYHSGPANRLPAAGAALTVKGGAARRRAIEAAALSGRVIAVKGKRGNQTGLPGQPTWVL